jgi:hypothetical protein
MPKPLGLTKKDKDLLERIRTYETYSDEQVKEMWGEVRRRERRKFPDGFLQKYQHRVALVRAFVDEYRKEHPGGYPKARDFRKNKLNFICEYYSGSPYEAFVEAGFANPENAVYDSRLAEAPWAVLETVPHHYWESEVNRIKATQNFVRTCGKNLTELAAEDFVRSGLSRILEHTDGFYNALKEAGFDIQPWELTEVSQNYFESLENRVKAIRWMVGELGKPITTISRDDFKESGLGGLIQKHYHNTVDALREAGYKIESLDMNYVPHGTWQNPKEVQRAVKLTAEKLGKSEKRVTRADLSICGYSGLFNTHKMSDVKDIIQKRNN